jgi:hypothetical protein
MISSRSFRPARWWLLGLFLLGLAAGCSSEPTQPAPDSEAAKKAQEDLNRQRHKEWGNQ